MKIDRWIKGSQKGKRKIETDTESKRERRER